MEQGVPGRSLCRGATQEKAAPPERNHMKNLETERILRRCVSTQNNRKNKKKSVGVNTYYDEHEGGCVCVCVCVSEVVSLTSSSPEDAGAEQG